MPGKIFSIIAGVVLKVILVIILRESGGEMEK